MKTTTLLSCAILLALPLMACKPAAPPADSKPAETQTAKPAPPSEDHPEHAAADAHASHAASATALPPVPAKPWPSDAPLRKGMEDIAKAATQAHQASAAGSFGKPEADALAASIDKAFKYMAANCKLEPEADVTLHAIVAQFMAAAKQLQANPKSPEAMARLHQLMQAYPKYFEHPGWSGG